MSQTSSANATVPSVTMRYYAAAREAAGITSEVVEAATLQDALRVTAQRHDDRYRAVLALCSFAVDGDVVTGEHVSGEHGVRDGAVIDVLPPFAGGAR
jgi:molybdopterin converting factor small subunit